MINPTPPAGTVLQVQCGSCLKIVNVPADHLEPLLHLKMYNCPHCKSRQSIQLAAQQETALRFQARQMMQMLPQSAAGQSRQQEQQQARQQQTPAVTASAQLAALQRMAAAAAAAGQGGAQASSAVQAPAAAAVLQALQSMAATHQKAAAAAAARPAAPSNPSAALQQLAQMVQQQQQQQRAGSGPAAAFTQQLTQQQLDLLRQMAQRNASATTAAAAGGVSAQLAQAQLERFLPLTNELNPDEVDDAEDSEVRDTFMEYKPSKLTFGKPHPDAVVETASLAAVEPPDITYKLKAHDALVETLSALQLESVVYACQRHQQMLPDGSRGGFFIGDGAGVGKGRTIAGLILENWKQGRRKHLWLSVGSDLKIDTQRDLDDVGANDMPLHALNKLPYGKLSGHKIGVKEGVMFLTYSSLISSSDRNHTRFKQLLEWCGKDFDGLIVFDESHKAKNLVPDAGMRATQVGLKVREIQLQLPQARVVYCSATGASEPRNMGYMVRLGLWGEGNPAFNDFGRFLEAVQGKNSTGGGTMAALELVAMDMKAQGMYVCRTLSFAGAEFETVEAPLEDPMGAQYAAAAATWNQLFREFLYAEEQAAAGEAAAAVAGGAPSDGGRRRGGFGDARSMTWRSFWAGHQAFFRHMTMAAKVPAVVRMARAAVANGKCAVVGLQSTGEARTADVVADKGEELDDFVSGPKELLIRLVEHYYPLPPNPNALEEEADSESDEDFHTAAVAEAVARNAIEGRNQVYRGAKARAVRYKEWSESEDIGDSSAGAAGSDSDSSASSDDGQPKNGGSGRRQGASGSTAAASAQKQQRSGKSGSRQDDSGGRSKGSGVADGTTGRRRAARQQRRSRQQRSRSSGEDSGEEYDPTAKRDSASSSGSSSGDSSSSSDDDNEKPSSQGQQQEADGQQQQQAKEAAAEKAKRKEARQEAKRAEEEARAAKRALAEAAYAAAVKRKEAVMAAVQQLELPNNPLDTLIDQLGGPNEVAEMTGRKGRLVRSKSSAGVVFEARNASGVSAGATLEMINVHERELFLAGKKLIAIISEAASAGISLHADRRAVNQRRRVHLTLELPWSADKAIQQFGRTHRANQAHGPQYRLIFTPLGGERRFAAAVARRLESLGALTQGDRRAGPSLSAFNYESVWGQRALREMYRAIMRDIRVPLATPQPCKPGPGGEPPATSLEAFMGKARALLLNCGIIRHNKSVVSASHINEYLSRPDGAPAAVGRIDEKDMADVPRFLNRLLGLAPDAQQALFDFYQVTLEALMDKARREGALDEGIVDVKAHTVCLVGEPRELHRDATTGATTVMYEIEMDRGLPWAAAQQKLEEHCQQLAMAAAGLSSPGAAAIPAILTSIPTAEQEAQEGQEGVAAAALPPVRGELQQQQQPDAQQGKEAVKQEEDKELKQEDQQGAEAMQQDEQRSQQPSNGALPGKQEQQELDEPPAAAAAAVKAETGPSPRLAAAGRKRQRQGKAGNDAAAPAQANPEAEAAGKSSPAAKRSKANGAASPGSVGRAAAAAAKPGAKPKALPQQAKRKQSVEAATIDLTLADSDDDGEEDGKAAAGAKAAGKRSKAASSDAAADSDSDAAEVVEVEAGDAGGAVRAPPKRKWESGFYRARQEGINRQVHVMLALQVAGSDPPTFAIYRPATGRSRQIMSQQELKARYLQLEPRVCKPLWEKTYDGATGSAKVLRKRTLHVLGGAVMHCWGAVQHALVRQVKSSERRMRVLRIATTGEHPQRLVGMLIPEPAVDEVVAQLAQRQEREKERAAAAAIVARDAEGDEAAAAAAAAASEGGGSAPAAAPELEAAPAAAEPAAAAAAPAAKAAARAGGAGRGGGGTGGGRGRGRGKAAAQSPVAQRGRRQQPQRGSKQRGATVPENSELSSTASDSSASSDSDAASSASDADEVVGGSSTSSEPEAEQSAHSSDDASTDSGGKARRPKPAPALRLQGARARRSRRGKRGD